MSRPEYGSDLHLWNDALSDPEFRASVDAGLKDVQAGRTVARSTDPGTSWEAARSIDPDKISEFQSYILTHLRHLGPMTDEELWDIEDAIHHGKVSPSGLRSRRSELVSMGLVRDSGRKDTLRSGRRAIVWEAV